MDEPLTDLEEQLVAGAIAGTPVGLGEITNPDPDEMSKWGRERTVRASVIRDLLRGLHPETGDPVEVDPRGVHLAGCVIDGRLDLERVNTTVNLRLLHCFITRGIEARHAQLQGLDLEASIICGEGEEGAVRLQGAHVRTWISFSRAIVLNDKGPAVMADGLSVGNDIYFDEAFKAWGRHPGGLIRLVEARIGGALYFTSAHIVNKAGSAIRADNIKVDSSIFLDHDFERGIPIEIDGEGGEGAVRLTKSRLGGHLSARTARIRNSSGPALSADGIVADGGVLFDNLFSTGAGRRGTIRLSHAKINGELRLPGVEITNSSGPALDAEGLLISGNLILGSGALHEEAHVNRGRHGDGYHVHHIGARYDGNNSRGAVNLRGARIEGDLFCIGVSIRNESGPALAADRITVTGDVGLDGTHQLIGRGREGVLQLQGATISGRLYYGEPFVGRENDGAGGAPWVNVDGLTYRDIPSCGLKSWLRLLQNDSGPYRPQPYQQLAAAARANGHVGESRQVLIAQRSAQRRSEKISRWRAAWLWFLEHSVGYGYRPLRVVAGLVTSTLLALFLALGPLAGALISTPASGGTSATCSEFQRAGVALNATLPLVKVAWSEGCVAGVDWRGSTWNILALGLGAVSWICATLFVAGFTRLVRDP